MTLYNKFKYFMEEMISWVVSLITCQHMKFQFFSKFVKPWKWSLSKTKKLRFGDLSEKNGNLNHGLVAGFSRRLMCGIFKF